MELQRYSRLVFDLYAGARKLAPVQFQEWALVRIRHELPFASAWWGLATAEDHGNTLLHSATFGTRPEFVREIDAIREVDDMRKRLLSPAGATAMKSGHSPHDSLRRFDERHGLHSILATAMPDFGTSLMPFISLYRPESAPAFTEEERAAKEALVPHLMQAWQANWTWGSETGADAPAALLADDGQVIDANVQFVAMLRAAWPAWCGKRLILRQDGFEGPRTARAKLSVVVARGGAPGTRRVLLCLNRTGTLTAREHAVADHYASGLSYKEIARAMAISPDTVRSYIKTCFTKLGVSNKVQLQQVLGTSFDTAAASQR